MRTRPLSPVFLCGWQFYPGPDVNLARLLAAGEKVMIKQRMQEVDGCSDPGSRICVFLISKRRLLAEVITTRLLDAPQVTIVGWASNLESAFDEIGHANVEILVLDSSSDWNNATSAVREIRARFKEIKLLVIGPEPLDSHRMMLIYDGANEYLPQSASTAQLLETIESLHRNEVSYSPQLMTQVVSRLQRLAKSYHRSCPLSNREVDIVQLISQGLANKEIASRLGLSTATVKNHVFSIFKKLEVHRRRDAIRQAYLADLITPAPSPVPKMPVVRHDSSLPSPPMYASRR